MFKKLLGAIRPRRTKKNNSKPQTSAKHQAQQRRKLDRDQQKNQHKRVAERESLFALAELAFPDRGFSLDGVLLDASAGGVSFRPATHFIEDRTGDSVKILIEGLSKAGVIRATRANGYGIQLLQAFTQDELDLLRDLTIDLEDDEAA